MGPSEGGINEGNKEQLAIEIPHFKSNSFHCGIQDLPFINYNIHSFTHNYEGKNNVKTDMNGRTNGQSILLRSLRNDILLYMNVCYQRCISIYHTLSLQILYLVVCYE